ELLFGDRVLCEQRLVAAEVDVRVGEQRLVARQRSLRLLERHLVRARIDLDQRGARLDRLPLLEGDVHDLPADLALHGDRGERCNGAKPYVRSGNVRGGGPGGYHRHRPTAAEWAAAAGLR